MTNQVPVPVGQSKRAYCAISNSPCIGAAEFTEHSNRECGCGCGMPVLNERRAWSGVGGEFRWSRYWHSKPGVPVLPEVKATAFWPFSAPALPSVKVSCTDIHTACEGVVGAGKDEIDDSFLGKRGDIGSDVTN